MPRPRVDDYFPYHPGQIVRERDGRHLDQVRAVVSNLVLVVFEDTGWRGEFLASDIEPADYPNPFLCCETE